jgi:drug/metabolite transporter (DMT)-like permease
MSRVSIAGWVFVAAIGIYLGATARDDNLRIGGFVLAVCAAAVAAFELIMVLKNQRKNNPKRNPKE